MSFFFSDEERVLRECRKPITKGTYFTTSFISSGKYGNKNSCPPDLQIITICLLEFLSFSDFWKQLISDDPFTDISFKEQHISLFIPKIKTDKYNKGLYCKKKKNGFKTQSEKNLEMTGIRGLFGNY